MLSGGLKPVVVFAVCGSEEGNMNEVFMTLLLALDVFDRVVVNGSYSVLFSTSLFCDDESGTVNEGEGLISFTIHKKEYYSRNAI